MAYAAAAMAARGSRRGFSSGPRFRSYDDDYEDGPNMCWIAIFCVAGLTLAVTGAVYMSSSFSDPRANTIEVLSSPFLPPFLHLSSLPPPYTSPPVSLCSQSWRALMTGR